MKKASLIFSFALLFFHSAANAQTIGFKAYTAVCPFEWSGDIWPDELGTVLAEDLERRIRFNERIYLMPIDESKELLDKAGLENTWNIDPDILREAFYRKNISLVITGKIEKLSIIRDVDGTPYANVELKIAVVDIRERAIIFSDSVEYRTKPDAYVTAETPFDRDIALSMLSGGANRLANRLDTGLDRYYNRHQPRRIF